MRFSLPSLTRANRDWGYWWNSPSALQYSPWPPPGTKLWATPLGSGAVSWTCFSSHMCETDSWCSYYKAELLWKHPTRGTSLIWSQIIRTNIKVENNAGNRLGDMPQEMRVAQRRSNHWSSCTQTANSATRFIAKMIGALSEFQHGYM